MTSRLVRILPAMVIAIGILFGPRGGIAEERTVRAMMVWQGEGTAVRIGESKAMLVAIIEGSMFIDGNKGVLHTASILCPITAIIGHDLSQTVRGRCSIVDIDGDRVYARFTCKGEHFKGCRGLFTLVGGSGKFKGIQGGGPVTFLSKMGDLRLDQIGIVRRRTIGLANFPALRIQTVEKK